MHLGFAAELFMLLFSYVGIPNALNVVSNFPFLVIGLIGLVLCHHGNYFKLR